MSTLSGILFFLFVIQQLKGGPVGKYSDPLPILRLTEKLFVIFYFNGIKLGIQ